MTKSKSVALVCVLSATVICFGSLGIPRAVSALAEENTEWAQQVLSDPSYDSWFSDKTAFAQETGGVEGLADSMTAGQLSVFALSVDAAALVFMHSAVDAAAQDLCRVCALAAPHDWEDIVSGEKVALSEVRAHGYEGVFADRLSKHVAELERESLLKRVDVLFQVCKPEGYVRRGYSYDRERLAKIDLDRQAVIHGDGVLLNGVEAALKFLFDTGLFLFGMVNHRYDVRIDPELAR